MTVSGRDADNPMFAAFPGRRAAGTVEVGPVRRLPLRDSQPPFDDELPPATGDARRFAQPTLALAFAFPDGLPAVPDVPDAVTSIDLASRRLRLVSPVAEPDNATAKTRRRSRRDPGDDEFGPQQTPRAFLPDPTPWAGRLVQAVVEVSSGVRPPTQLVRWTTSEVYEAVTRRARLSMTATRGYPSARWAEVVRSVHVSEPVEGVAEVCAIVQQGPRCRAVALRLEGIDGRWQCTALQLG